MEKNAAYAERSSSRERNWVLDRGTVWCHFKPVAQFGIRCNTLTPECSGVNLSPPSPGSEQVRAGESQEYLAHRCPSTWKETTGARGKCSHPSSALVRKFRKHSPFLFGLLALP